MISPEVLEEVNSAFPEHKEKSNVPLEEFVSHFEEPLTVDDQEMYLIDGDTLKDKRTGDRIRIPYYDAGEIGRIGKDNELYLGEYGASTQSKIIHDIIKREGFNTLVDTGETSKREGDDRPLKDLVNAQGVTLSNYLHSERVVDTSRWMTQEQEALRAFGDLSDQIFKVKNEATPIDRARAVMDNLMGDSALIPVFGTDEQVLRGSNLESKFYQSVLNDLNNRIKKETDPEKRAELEEELAINRQQLTVSLNTKPKALFMYNDFRKTPNKVGFLQELENSGWKSMYMLENTLAGFSNWVGDVIDADEDNYWVSDEWVADSEERLRTAGYTTDMWSVRNPLDASRFFASTVIQYGPQLAAITGAASAGFAVGGPVGMVLAGGTAGLIMAISEVYQGMAEETKDPLYALGIAMPIALLDVIGGKRVANIGAPFLEPGTNLFTKEGRAKIKDLILKEKLYRPDGKTPTDKQLEKFMNRKTLDILNAAGIDLAQAARDKLIAKNTLRDLGSEIVKRAGTEGLTEALQEAVKDVGLADPGGLWGRTGEKQLKGWDDTEELLWNMLESGTIGAVVGGTYSAPGILKEQKNRDRWFFENLPEDKREGDLYLESRINDAMIKENGEKYDTTEIVGEAFKDISESMKGPGGSPRPTLSKMARGAENTGKFAEIRSLTKNPGRAIRAYKDFLNGYLEDPASGKVRKNLAKIADLFGAIRSSVGLTVPQDQKQLASNWMSMIPSKTDLKKIFKVRDTREIFKLLQNPEAITNPEVKQAALFVRQKILAPLGEAVKSEIKARNIDQKRLGNFNLTLLERGQYFIRPNYIDPRRIDEKFRMLLKNAKWKQPAFGENPGVWENFTDDYIDDLVRKIETGHLPILDKMALQQAGVFTNEEFLPYVSEDFYDTLQSSLNSLAQDVGVLGGFGVDGEVIGHYLNKAVQEGEISKEKRTELAQMSLDYINMVQGSYRNIKSPTIRWAQENAMFASTLVFMDSNLAANTVEAVNGVIGMEGKWFWKYTKPLFRTYFKSLYSDITALADAVTFRKFNLEKEKRRLGDEDFNRLVLMGAIRSDIAYLEGANTNSKKYKTANTVFYRFNQVEGTTMAFRSARSALAWEDIIKMMALVEQDAELGYTTNAGRWARDRLNYYRVDYQRIRPILNRLADTGLDFTNSIPTYDELKAVLSPKDLETLRKQYRIGMTNYTDEFSVRPEPGSVPRILEDPALRLFTQFKRFIAHFTANNIRQTWRLYIRRGPPGMSYGTFKALMFAYLTAYFSMLMKDFIVYGEKAPWLDDEDEEEPRWLNTSTWRAAKYSGWTGTPSMILDAIERNYQNQRNMDPFQNLYDSIVGESPALNLISDYIFEPRDPLYNLRSAEGFKKRVARTLPFVGDIKPAREYAEKILGVN